MFRMLLCQVGCLRSGVVCMGHVKVVWGPVEFMVSGVMCWLSGNICRVFWGHVQGVRGHMECVGCLRFKCVGGENGMYSVGCLRNMWSVWECVSVVCGQQVSWQTACSHGLLSFR